MGTIREQILIASTLASGTIRQLLGSPNTGTGSSSGGELSLDVIMEDIDIIAVAPVATLDVDLDDSDFTVRVIEKTTIIIKE